MMQGLADGYFIIPYTLGNILAEDIRTQSIPTDHPAFEDAENAVRERINRLLSIKGTESVSSFHKRLGKIMWNKCGMARNEQGLKEAIEEIKALRNDFWQQVRIPGGAMEMNTELDKAGRVADFLELAELMCIDALDRKESCGGHFREEYQTEDGEARRNDEQYLYVSAWEYQKEGHYIFHNEELIFETVHPSQRSYK
jgi:succinate dehydrogenase / fumarate reductase flavoprotein subunit